jgi:hypothetical protein
MRCPADRPPERTIGATGILASGHTKGRLMSETDKMLEANRVYGEDYPGH